MRHFVFCAIAILFTNHLFADTYPRQLHADVQHYAFTLHVSDTSNIIYVKEKIEVAWNANNVHEFRLDLLKKNFDHKGMTVGSVRVNGKAASFQHDSASLLITLGNTGRSTSLYTIELNYYGEPASGLKIANNKYGDRSFFSDNWPDRGRGWLALVDHPYDKATCEFVVHAPSYYQVVSNGLMLESSDEKNDYRVTHWKQSVPIAPWLYVLGIARFAVQYHDQFDNKSIETWVYPQDREKGFYDFAIPTRSVLEYYSSYVGPFAYEKLANIQSNSVSGGMEAASAILYSENAVVGDRNERWRNVVIHEIAHQWFGNAVTESDWDDVWLSEGFATYFTLLYIEHAYGREAFLKGLADSKKRVDDFHAKNPGYRIVHDNLSDMSKVTSSHTYQKGSWTLHMLRGIIGDEVFFKGIMAYYARYYNSNATTHDFIAVMESVSGKDLQQFSQQWLYKPGALHLEVAWQYDESKKALRLKVKQTQNDGSLFAMPVQIVALSADGKKIYHILNVESAEKDFAFPVPFNPVSVVVDPDKWVLMDAVVKNMK